MNSEKVFDKIGRHSQVYGAINLNNYSRILVNICESNISFDEKVDFVEKTLKDVIFNAAKEVYSLGKSKRYLGEKNGKI